MTNVAENLILITAIMLMAVGVYSDITKRIFPNSIILSLIVLGLFYSLYARILPQALTGFLVINAIGIWAHKYKLLSSGDMKFLSTMFFYLNLVDIKQMVLYLIFLFLIGSIFGLAFYYKKYQSTDTIKQELKKEASALKYLMMFKINTFGEIDKSKYASKEEMLKNTMPYTVPIFIAFVVVQVITLFV